MELELPGPLGSSHNITMDTEHGSTGFNVCLVGLWVTVPFAIFLTLPFEQECLLCAIVPWGYVICVLILQEIIA
jgi:hypothetical protein